MAMQYATAQGITIQTYDSADGKTPTTPTNPVVTISKDGAGFGAAAGVVTALTGYGVHVAFTIADMTAAAIAVLVTSDNCDPATLNLVTEAGYTADKAAFLDASVAAANNGTPPSPSAISSQVATDLGTAHGTGSWATATGFSTLTAAQVWSYSSRTLSGFGTLVADVAAAVWSAVARTITGGTVTSVGTDAIDADALAADAVAEIAAAVAGTGANTVTVTVRTAGGTVYEGVRVAADNQSETGNQWVQYTNASGQCVFHVGAGPWRFIAAGSAAQSGGATNVTVSGATLVTITVTAVTLPVPTDPDSYALVGDGNKLDANIPFGQDGMVAEVIKCTPDSARVSATDGKQYFIVGTEAPTNSSGVWSIEIPKSAVGAKLTIRFTWTPTGTTNTTYEDWEGTLSADAVNDDDQMIWEELVLGFVGRK